MFIPVGLEEQNFRIRHYILRLEYECTQIPEARTCVEPTLKITYPKVQIR